MFKVSRELEIHPILKSRGHRNLNFGFCGEEYYINFNGTDIKWDMLGRDALFLYLIEIKINKISDEELALLNLVGEKFRSFKPIKVLLMTLPLTERKRNRIKEYKYIKHIELEDIVHDPNIPMKKVKFSKSVDYNFKLVEILAYLKYEYFDFYLGYKFIYDKFIILKFRFNNDMGIILRFSICNSDIEYQVVNFIWEDYYDVRKIFCKTSKYNLNILFENVKSDDYYYIDTHPEREKKLLDILGKI